MLCLQLVEYCENETLKHTSNANVFNPIPAFLVIEAFLLTHSANSASEGVGNKAVQCLQSKGRTRYV